MGLFSFFKRTRASPKEERSDKLTDFIRGVDLDGVGLSNAGASVDEDTALKISAVYACVKVISETIASLPLKLHKEESNGDTAKAKHHPLFTLLADCPNTEMTAFTFREMMMTNLLLWGNAYAYIRRNRMGEIAELYPLKAKNMEVFRDPATGSLRYRYTSDNEAKTIIYKPRQVLHIPAFSFDGVVGVSPITYAREAMGLSLAAEEFGARWFSNGARPGAILEHPTTIKDPDKLRAAWESVYKGVKNSNKIAVLEEGVKYRDVGMSPQDSQFLDTRQFQLAEICRIFRVPPHMIHDLSRSTFSNIEHQSIDFVVHTIRPWLVRWEQAIKRALLTENERTIYFAKFKVDGLLRGDFNSRMQGYAIGIQNGFMSPNCVRKLEDMNQIPKEEGGSNFMVNGNLKCLGDTTIGGADEPDGKTLTSN
jgi:HK97 family phage portal protein